MEMMKLPPLVVNYRSRNRQQLTAANYRWNQRQLTAAHTSKKKTSAVCTGVSCHFGLF